MMRAPDQDLMKEEPMPVLRQNSAPA